jgi:uncharacterized membrane protein YeaQ/YmgE (transglycosylase-associated protein family)
MVLLLANLVVSVLVATTALAVPSMERRVAILLGLGGATTANFLFWVVAPTMWTNLLSAWVCSVVGALLAVVAWGVVRSVVPSVPARRRS